MLPRLILFRGFITPRHGDRKCMEKEEQGKYYFISHFFKTLYSAFDLLKVLPETKWKKNTFKHQQSHLGTDWRRICNLIFNHK